MNKEDACDILGIPYSYTEKEMKTQYRKLALKYHPDKNKDKDDTKFHEIKEAYEYLSGSNYKCQYEYFDTLKQFIMASHINIEIEIVYNILHTFFDNQTYTILDTFKLLSYSTSSKIYQFLKKYNNLFDIPDSLLDLINNSIDQTDKHNNVYHIFNPTLDDIFSHNIFKYTYLNEDYYIPSWHEEVHFKLSNNKILILKCIPKLDKQINIDNENNIHVSLDIVFDKTLIHTKKKIVNITDTKQVSIHINNLYMKENQCVKYLNKGIPKIDIDNIYNNINISNLYIHVHLA